MNSNHKMMSTSNFNTRLNEIRDMYMNKLNEIKVVFLNELNKLTSEVRNLETRKFENVNVLPIHNDQSKEEPTHRQSNCKCDYETDSVCEYGCNCDSDDVHDSDCDSDDAYNSDYDYGDDLDYDYHNNDYDNQYDTYDEGYDCDCDSDDNNDDNDDNDDNDNNDNNDDNDDIDSDKDCITNSLNSFNIPPTDCVCYPHGPQMLQTDSRNFGTNLTPYDNKTEEHFEPIPFICDCDQNMFMNQEQAFDLVLNQCSDQCSDQCSESSFYPNETNEFRETFLHNLNMISDFRRALKNMVRCRFGYIIKNFSLISTKKEYEIRFEVFNNLTKCIEHKIVPIIKNETDGRITRLRFNCKIENEWFGMDSDFLEFLNHTESHYDEYLDYVTEPDCPSM